MSSDLVLYEVRKTAAVLTLNRPERANALCRPLITAVHEAVDRAAEDPRARAVIVTGAGKNFCAGMDLAELQGSFGLRPEETPVWDDALRLARLYERIYTLPKPTVAAVKGAAAAGGCGLVTVCDLALVSPGAKLGYPEVRRGLVAAMVMPHLLRHVGERAARYLLLTGELIDAEEAVRIGLANAVVPAERLLDEALALSRSLAQGGPEALRRTKELLYQFSRQAVSVEEGARESAAPRLADECKQGLEAFFAKESPPWAPE